MNQLKLHHEYSLVDKNFGHCANNVVSSSMEAVARPWFKDIVDPQIDSALRDLNSSAARRIRAMEFLGLELVQRPAVA